jgi:hypothetical protein
MSQPADECGHAFRGEASVANFTNWLTQFLAEPRATFYVQHSLKASDKGVCITASLPTSFALTDWEQGRVFNDEFELRWLMVGDVVYLLLLTERDDKTAAYVALCEWQPIETDYEVTLTQHILVGAFYRRDGDWFFAEAGVPRAFRYPLDTKGLTNHDRAHAVLNGKHYRRGGRTVLTRFTHLSVEHERREGKG